MNLKDFSTSPWWDFMDPSQRELLKTSFYLLAWAKQNKGMLHDYSFLVMPAAKAFEGYLKKILFTLNLISEKEYKRDRFRLGKALNPELEHRIPKQCLFNEISRACSPKLAEDLWQCWKKCRNRLFHYFPSEQQIFSLQESEERLEIIIDTIDNSFIACQMTKKGGPPSLAVEEVKKLNE